MLERIQKNKVENCRRTTSLPAIVLSYKGNKWGNKKLRKWLIQWLQTENRGQVKGGTMLSQRSQAMHHIMTAGSTFQFKQVIKLLPSFILTQEKPPFNADVAAKTWNQPLFSPSFCGSNHNTQKRGCWQKCRHKAAVARPGRISCLDEEQQRKWLHWKLCTNTPTHCLKLEINDLVKTTKRTITETD